MILLHSTENKKEMNTRPAGKNQLILGYWLLLLLILQVSFNEIDAYFSIQSNWGTNFQIWVHLKHIKTLKNNEAM